MILSKPSRLMVQSISGAWVIIAYSQDNQQGWFMGFVFSDQQEALDYANHMAQPSGIVVVISDDDRKAPMKFKEL